MSRTRTTWGGDRKASAPPATPGYGTEDQGHPAHQPDPAYEEYAKGDPSAWAEDVRQPPYPQGNPPADPGYDVEDQDHPAHENPPRVPKEASLRAQVEKKASKCIRVARVMLGCDATAQMVEDQALDLMDLPEDNLDAIYARMSGGFLAQDEEPEVVDDDIAALLAQDEEPPAEDGVMARIRAMEEEIARLRKGAADQNAPNKGGATEEQVKAEAEATAKDEEPGGGAAKSAAANSFRQMLASMDTDGDGFLTASDWTGTKAMFAQMDTDRDGIVAVDEAVKAFFEDETVVEDDLGLDPEETALLAELESEVACGEPVMAAKKAEDEPDGDEAEPDGDEAEGAKKASDDEDADDEAKEASDAAAVFAMTGDPMGLADGPSLEDDALLAEVFGGKVAKKADDDEDEDDEPKDDESKDDEGGEVEFEETEDEDEKEGGKKGGKKASAQSPQRPKTASGPKTLGTQTRTAASREMNDLSNLWDSAPDVSAVFGVPKP